MASSTFRNLATFVAFVAAMGVLARYGSVLFGWIPVPISGLGAGLALITLIGIAGSFAFRGSTIRRALLVLLAGSTYGLLLEVFSPDPRHAGAQMFVTVAFSVWAALISVAASLVRRMFGDVRDPDHV